MIGSFPTLARAERGRPGDAVVRYASSAHVADLEHKVIVRCDQTRTVEDPREPHLSVVAVSRNDDHGGDMRSRMQHFVDGFVAQCRRHRLDAELILVEWNPPPDRPPLADVLRWPEDFGPAAVRIVTVPPELHASFAHASQLPLFQMIGKNVGIRRARGRFVLATNVDILLDDATVRYLRDRLRPGSMLRIDRYDVPDDLPRGASFDRVIEECSRSFAHVNLRFGVFDVRRRRILGLGDGGMARVTSLVAELRILGWRDSLRRRRLQRTSVRRVAACVAGAVPSIVRSARIVSVALIRAVVRVVGATRSMARGFERRKVVPLRRLPVRLYHLARTNVMAGVRAMVGMSRRLTDWASRALARVGRTINSRLSRLRRLAAGLARWLTGLFRVGRADSARYERSRWLHTNACGDFTLLARDDWVRLRGYPEWPIFSWHLDSAFLYAAAAHDVAEMALGTRYRIYHLDHSSGSGWSPEGAARLFARLNAKGIPYLSDEDLRRWQHRVAADPRAAIVNGPAWGLGDHQLPERLVSPGLPGSPNRISTTSRISETLR